MIILCSTDSAWYPPVASPALDVCPNLGEWYEPRVLCSGVKYLSLRSGSRTLFQPSRTSTFCTNFLKTSSPLICPIEPPLILPTSIRLFSSPYQSDNVAPPSILRPRRSRQHRRRQQVAQTPARRLANTHTQDKCHHHWPWRIRQHGQEHRPR